MVGQERPPARENQRAPTRGNDRAKIVAISARLFCIINKGDFVINKLA